LQRCIGEALRTATFGGSAHNIATNIAHQPFGGIRSWTYGNGLTRGQRHDLNGRVTELDTRNGTNDAPRTVAVTIRPTVGAMTLNGGVSARASMSADARLDFRAWPSSTSTTRQ